jgi:hypothetical protein
LLSHRKGEYFTKLLVLNLGFTQQIFHDHPDYLAQEFPLIQLYQGFTDFQIAEIVDYQKDVYKPGLETIKTSKILSQNPP